MSFVVFEHDKRENLNEVVCNAMRVFLFVCRMRGE